MGMIWVLEREMFSDHQSRLSAAASSAGHRVIFWKDLWLEEKNWPSLKDEYVIFQGSLNIASRIVEEFPWKPGAFCNTAGFACNAWYGEARPWLLHKKWVICNAASFVKEPEPYLEEIGATDSFFVRPDSPLKPFSGRVVQLSDLSLEALDYGFYFDDETIPVVITPVVEVSAEWRFVIAAQKPIAVSSYEAPNRSESESKCPPEVWQFAEEVSARLTPPDPIYILDVCLCGESLKLLELNPFSGADLYGCDREAVVAAVEGMAKK